MKIQITIEFDPDGLKPVKVCREIETAPKRAKIAEVAPPPVPAEPPADKEPVTRPGAGPQFDPGFLAVIRDIHEPFTRRAVSVASGLDLGCVTLRLNRMHKKGWIEQPSPGLWQKTKAWIPEIVT